MTITYTWKITNLDAKADGKTVIGAGWTYTGADGDFFSSVPDYTAIPQAPLDGLTEDAAVQAVKTALGDKIAAFESDITKAIAGQKTPVAADVSLPWESLP